MWFDLFFSFSLLSVMEVSTGQKGFLGFCVYTRLLVITVKEVVIYPLSAAAAVDDCSCLLFEVSRCSLMYLYVAYLLLHVAKYLERLPTFPLKFHVSTGLCIILFL